MKDLFTCFLILLFISSSTRLRSQVLTPIQIDSLGKAVDDELLGIWKRTEAGRSLAYHYMDLALTDSLVYYADKMIQITASSESLKAIRVANHTRANGYMYQGQVSHAIRCYSIAADLAVQSENPRAAAGSLLNVGVAYLRQGKFEQSDSILIKAAYYANESQDSNLIVQAYSNRGVLLNESGRQEEAIRTTLAAIPFARGNPIGIAQLYGNAGAYSSELGFPERALEFYLKAHKVASMHNIDRVLPSILNNIGNAFLDKSQVDSALHYFTLSNKFNAKAVTKLYTLIGLGSAHLKLKNLEDGKRAYERAFEIAEDIESISEMAVVLHGLGEISLAERNLQESRRFFIEANDLLENLDGTLVQEISVKSSLLKISSLLDEPIDSTILLKYFALRDSIFSIDMRASLAALTDEFNVAEARADQAQARLLTIEERATRQKWTYLAIGTFLIGATLSLTQYWDRQRKQKYNDELVNLNNQINRLNQDLNHRTSNYLESIILLLERQKERAVSNKLDTTVVSSLERQVLAFTKVQKKLGADLDSVNLKEYLEDFCQAIRETLRGQDVPVTFEVNVSEVEVKPAFAAPLALIINELVTNSMKHASREPGILRLKLDVKQRDDEKLRVLFSDGSNVAKELDTKVFSTGQGVDLILGFTEELNGEIRRYAKESYDYEAVFEDVN